VKDIQILQDRDRLLAIMKNGDFHKTPYVERAQAQVAAE
jgi:hypothetical protein